MSAASYLSFLPQHTDGGHTLIAVVDRGDGPEANHLPALGQLIRKTIAGEKSIDFGSPAHLSGGSVEPKVAVTEEAVMV